jgi:anaerobic magnesium-protoporphyrin IX monomethyl ester cyclase
VFYEDQFNFLTKMCLNHVRMATCRMSALARARGAMVIAAGADVSDHPEGYFRHGVQYALLGEADTSLVELLAVLSGRQAGPVEAIAGLAMPSADTIQRTAARPPERWPDVFPFPA